jgi:hypothetical protein
MPLRQDGSGGTRSARSSTSNSPERTPSHTVSQTALAVVDGLTPHDLKTRLNESQHRDDERLRCLARRATSDAKDVIDGVSGINPFVATPRA